MFQVVGFMFAHLYKCSATQWASDAGSSYACPATHVDPCGDGISHLQSRLGAEQRLVLQVADVVVLSHNRSTLSPHAPPAVFVPCHLLQQQLHKHTVAA